MNSEAAERELTHAIEDIRDIITALNSAALHIRNALRELDRKEGGG